MTDVRISEGELRRFFESLSPPVVTMSFGGSAGRQDGDALSDLDVFLIVEDHELAVFLKNFRFSLTESFESALCISGPVMIEGFGFKFAIITATGPGMDVFVNSPTTFQINPLCVGNRIVFDHNGFMTELLTKDLVGSFQSSEFVLGKAREDLYWVLQRILKFAKRRELVPSIYCHAKLLRIYLALRKHLLGIPYDGFAADRKLPDTLGRDAEREAQSLLTSSTWGEVLNSTDRLTHQCRTMLKRIGADLHTPSFDRRLDELQASLRVLLRAEQAGSIETL